MSHKQAGGPPGESTVDWCLYQLNGAAEFEVSEGDHLCAFHGNFKVSFSGDKYRVVKVHAVSLKECIHRPDDFGYVYLQAHFLEAHVTVNRVDSWADCRNTRNVNLVQRTEMHSQYCQALLVISATSFCFKVIGILWKRTSAQRAAFCAVAKVPGVVNGAIVSTVTAIRGESWCNSTDAYVFSSSMSLPLCVYGPGDVDFLVERRTLMKVDGHVTSEFSVEKKIFLSGIKTICLRHGLLGVTYDLTLIC